MKQPSDIYAVMRREQDALALETVIGKCPPFVAVNDLEDITRVPTSLRWDHKTTVRPLPHSKGLASIVDCPSLESTVLWVETNNSQYRDEYLLFLNSEYHLGLSKIPAPFDVDHLYNQKRAKEYGLRFVRLALVGHRANRSHGAAYEKDLTKNEALRERRDLKQMDEITSMKYFGFLSPLRDDPRDSEVDAYAKFAAAKLGLNPDEVRRSVRYLREKASTPWARKP